MDPAEYREFLMLGHGGVYELDVDRCCCWLLLSAYVTEILTAPRVA